MKVQKRLKKLYFKALVAPCVYAETMKELKSLTPLLWDIRQELKMLDLTMKQDENFDPTDKFFKTLSPLITRNFHALVDNLRASGYVPEALNLFSDCLKEVALKANTREKLPVARIGHLLPRMIGLIAAVNKISHDHAIRVRVR